MDDGAEKYQFWSTLAQSFLFLQSLGVMLWAKKKSRCMSLPTPGKL
jgi:hypothetical protein